MLLLSKEIVGNNKVISDQSQNEMEGRWWPMFARINKVCFTAPPWITQPPVCKILCILGMLEAQHLPQNMIKTKAMCDFETNL